MSAAQVALAGVVAVALLYAALMLFAWRLGDRLILPAPASTYRPGALEALHTIRTADGVELAALHLPNESARYTILYSHGNGEDLGNMLPVLEQIHALGYAVFAVVAFPGIGLIGGEVVQLGSVIGDVIEIPLAVFPLGDQFPVAHAKKATKNGT